MKLNKMKISRLTASQAKAVRGGYGSTQHNFTCTWCTGGDSFECSTVNRNETLCNTTHPY